MSEPTLKEKERKPRPKSRKVVCVATLTAAGLSLGLIACGGGTASGTADQTVAQAQASYAQTGTSGSQGTTGGGESDQESQSGQPEGGPGAPPQLTSKEEKCLAGEGIELPDSNERGAPPEQGSENQRQSMTEAFEACGIEMPEPPSGDDGQGMGPPPSGEVPGEPSTRQGQAS